MPANATTVASETALTNDNGSSATEGEGEPASWPDAAAESEFLADARARGESVAPPKPTDAVVEEADPKSLPPLQELVDRIPADVREALDDLFRARFITVKRVPKRALKE